MSIGSTVAVCDDINSEYCGARLKVESLENGRANLSKDGNIVFINIPIHLFR